VKSLKETNNEKDGQVSENINSVIVKGHQNPDIEIDES